MKNIIIVGVPRSGKSTLSKLIKETYPNYNQFSFEAIRNGFIKSLPDLDMGNRRSEARKKVMPEFIMEMIHYNNTMLSSPSLVEGDFCTIEELGKLTTEDDLVICLGLGQRNIDDIVNAVKSHDKESDYTYTWDEKRLSMHFQDSPKRDKQNYEYCKLNNIKYYDTYDNREEVFKTILDDIYLINEDNKRNKKECL